MPFHYKRNKPNQKKLNSDGSPYQSPPPPRVYRLIKSKTTILDMAARMSAEKFTSMAQFALTQELKEQIASEILALRAGFLAFITANVAAHREWKTEFDAWTDYRISMKQETKVSTTT
jgi:hypothetical protein